MLEALEATDFQPLEGEIFLLSASDLAGRETRPGCDNPREVTLIEIRVLGGGDRPAGAATDRGGSRGSRRPFSLLFRGGAEALPQGIYEIAHSGLGALDLFLVPIGAEDGAMVYEAILA